MNSKPSNVEPGPAENAAGGLYRTTLAGPGGSLADAFGNLEYSPQVERVLRHSKRDLLSVLSLWS